MLKMTVVGLLVAFGAIFAGQAMEGSSLALLLQPSAFLIVFGGTLGAVVAQSRPQDFKHAFMLLTWLRKSPVKPHQEVSKQILMWSKTAHREGSFKLDQYASQLENPWLRKGLEMVADRHDVEVIREALTLEMRGRDAQYKGALRVWEAAAGYAPTIGIVGSVLGLLHVMSSLQSPDAMAAGLAVCFVATFYGLALANLVFLPMAAKLKSVVYDVTLQDEMLLEGLCMIAENRRPVAMERVLDSYETPVPAQANVKPMKKVA